MKKLWLAAAVACSAMAWTSAAAAQDAGARGVDEAWKKAMLAGDVDGVMACYAPDAVLWLPFAPKAVGAKEIRDAYAGMLAANTVVDVTFSNTAYETRQDLSAGWGQFVMTLKSKKPDGRTVVMTGRFTDVARKANGRWAYVADQASADPEPAPAPTPKP